MIEWRKIGNLFDLGENAAAAITKTITEAPDDSRFLRKLALAIWEIMRHRHAMIMAEKEMLRRELKFTQAQLDESIRALEEFTRRIDRLIDNEEWQQTRTH